MVAVAEATLHLRAEAAVIPPPAVVVVAIQRHVAVEVAAATAIPHRVVVVVAIVPAAARTEAEDIKLTYQQGQAAGTSSRRPCLPFRPSEIHLD
jgi:hypothetical protein